MKNFQKKNILIGFSRSIMKGKNIVKIAVSAILISFIVYKVGPGRIYDQFSHMILHYLLLAIFIEALGVAISAKKWQILLKSKSINVPFLRIWKHYYVGVFFNAFFPTTIGGDTVKAYRLSKELDSGIEAVSSVIMERLTGLVAIVCIGVAPMAMGYYLLPIKVLLIAFLVLIPGPAILIFFIFKTRYMEKIFSKPFFSKFPSLKEKIENAYHSLKEYGKKKKCCCVALAISFAYHFLLIFNNYVISLSLGMDISIFYFFIFVPVAEILVFLPITIQGFGIRSGTYVALFSQIGVSSARAFALGFSMQMIKLIGNLIGGMVYLSSNLRDLRNKRVK